MMAGKQLTHGTKKLRHRHPIYAKYWVRRCCQQGLQLAFLLVTRSFCTSWDFPQDLGVWGSTSDLGIFTRTQAIKICMQCYGLHS